MPQSVTFLVISSWRIAKDSSFLDNWIFDSDVAVWIWLRYFLIGFSKGRQWSVHIERRLVSQINLFATIIAYLVSLATHRSSILAILLAWLYVLVRALLGIIVFGWLLTKLSERFWVSVINRMSSSHAVIQIVEVVALPRLELLLQGQIINCLVLGRFVFWKRSRF